jgi:hypothetical protein
MIYYLRLLAAIADSNYQEAYWDAVVVSEWWISTLEAVTPFWCAASPGLNAGVSRGGF